MNSPEQEHAQARALLDAGCHTKYVAKYLNKSEHWVRKWRQRRYVRQGLADKPRTGKPSKVGRGVKKKKWVVSNTREEAQLEN